MEDAIEHATATTWPTVGTALIAIAAGPLFGHIHKFVHARLQAVEHRGGGSNAAAASQLLQALCNGQRAFDALCEFGEGGQAVDGIRRFGQRLSDSLGCFDNFAAVWVALSATFPTFFTTLPIETASRTCRPSTAAAHTRPTTAAVDTEFTAEIPLLTRS